MLKVSGLCTGHGVVAEDLVVRGHSRDRVKVVGEGIRQVPRLSDSAFRFSIPLSSEYSTYKTAARFWPCPKMKVVATFTGVRFSLGSGVKVVRQVRQVSRLCLLPPTLTSRTNRFSDHQLTRQDQINPFQTSDFFSKTLQNEWLSVNQRSENRFSVDVRVGGSVGTCTMSNPAPESGSVGTSAYIGTLLPKKPAPAPHLAHPDGRAALRIVLVTVPRVSRSCEHFPVRQQCHTPSLSTVLHQAHTHHSLIIATLSKGGTA